MRLSLIAFVNLLVINFHDIVKFQVTQYIGVAGNGNLVKIIFQDNIQGIAQRVPKVTEGISSARSPTVLRIPFAASGNAVYFFLMDSIPRY